MKLTFKEFRTLMGYEKAHTLMRYTCNFHGEEGIAAMNVRATIRWPVYILMLPIATLFQVVCLLWDGGLREFSLEPRCIQSSQVWHESDRYRKFKEMRGQ